MDTPISELVKTVIDLAEQVNSLRIEVASLRSDTKANSSPWLTREDAAAYARCSPSDIDRARRAGVLKADKWMRSTRYSKSEIDAAIRGQTLKRAKTPNNVTPLHAA